jgi:glutamine---fructose-6-phosphate transaminase (isomerizing)
VSSEIATPGNLTETEILSEPACWTECLRGLEKDAKVGEILTRFSSCQDWLFIGCGSSYYIGLAAAASWKALTGLHAQAIPASEILLFPDLILQDDRPFQPVLISRSGHTTEILKAAEYLEAKGLPTLAISCAPGQPLEKIAAATLCLPTAEEKSVVMTRSFTSMLIGLQFLAAKRAGNSSFLESLQRMAGHAQPVLDLMVNRIREFVQSHNFADYAFLGHGPFYGLACEGALKVEEMSESHSQSFHTMEFRHGPKSIVSPEILVTFFLSDTGCEAERDVLEEVKGLGGTTLVICNRADERTRKAADLLVEVNLNCRDFAQLAACLLPCQLLGLYTGLKKGLNPDQPTNLSKAVVLND